MDGRRRSAKCPSVCICRRRRMKAPRWDGWRESIRGRRVVEACATNAGSRARADPPLPPVLGDRQARLLHLEPALQLHDELDFTNMIPRRRKRADFAVGSEALARIESDRGQVRLTDVEE